MVREILVDWSTVNGGGKLSVFYGNDETPVATQRAAVAAFCEGLEDRLSQSTTWTVRTSGRILNTITGALEAEWTDSTAHTGQGLDPGQPVADATQGLIRWNTGAVVQGRMLKGRTFVPGLTQSSVIGGNLSPAAQGIFNAAGANLTGLTADMQIWHRPKAGAGGAAATISDATAWPELAVLRRRRDG